MYIEISSAEKVREIIEHLGENYPSTDIQVTPPRSGTAGYVGIEVNIHPTAKTPFTPTDVAKELESHEAVIFALESI
jgi:hypothetical protein